MSEMKIIDNLLPFNEVFYKTCFYNSLLPIIIHYNRDTFPVFLNDVIVYNNFSTNGILGFGMKYLQISNLKDVLYNIGIEMNSMCYREEIINDIKRSIKEDKPVIIWVDCFYESFRKDSYNKNHWTHTLLVHGYNDSERKMNIIEHKHRDNLSYENRTINYEDIKNSYEGYYKNFKGKISLPSYFDFSLNKFCEQFNLDIQYYKKVFVNNQKEKENEFLCGLEGLKNFAKNFENTALDEEKLNKNVDILINSFNSIINGKQIEVYKISKLFGDQDEMVKLQQELIQQWSVIRAIVAKYKFSNIYKQYSFISLFDKFKLIIEFEMLYLERIERLTI